MSNSNSDKLYARAKARSPGGVHSPVRAFKHINSNPKFIETASGQTIKDADGHAYTDYCMAFGPLILGHQHAAVAAAVATALQDGWSFGTAERYSLELAEFIHTHIPAAEMIRFMNSGTEAVMTAVRLARAATGRDKVLKFSGCYHGHTDAMLIEAGSGMAGIAASAGIPASVASDTIVAPLNDMPMLEQVFAAHGQSLAAAIIEPLPANNGLLPQRAEFLTRLRELSAAAGTLLIYDEVISGFRVAFGGIAATHEPQPDLRTWGKIIGGGFPVGAVAGSARLMEQLAPTGDVYQAGTLSANPIAMRAGLATLQELADGQIYAQLETLGARLESAINAVPGFGLTRAGSIFWIGNEALRSGPARDSLACKQTIRADFADFYQHLLNAGIYLAPSPYEVNFLSSAHTAADVDALISACQSYTVT